MNNQKLTVAPPLVPKGTNTHPTLAPPTGLSVLVKQVEDGDELPPLAPPTNLPVLVEQAEEVEDGDEFLVKELSWLCCLALYCTGEVKQRPHEPVTPLPQLARGELQSAVTCQGGSSDMSGREKYYQ